MNKLTLEFLVTTSAHIYFWMFIVMFIIHALFSFSDEYKRREKIREEHGKVNLGFTPVTIIFWFLFILSIYYL